MKLCQCGIVIALTILSTSVLADEPVCIIPEIRERVDSLFTRRMRQAEKWKLLSEITDESLIKKAEKCLKNNFLNNSIFFPKNLLSQSDIINLKKTALHYSPASNYGYARVYFTDGEERVFIKDSFYFDFNGRVYLNNLFFIKKIGESSLPEFFEFDYQNKATVKKNEECLRCHKEVKEQGFLFKKY